MAQNKVSEGKGRGRPRAYNPEAAIQQALDIFWHQGYSAASLDGIANAAGMNRPSLYAAFGNKHALYIKALEQYWVQAADAMRKALADNTLSLRQALTHFYQGQLSIYFSGDGQPRGCFMISTATSESMGDAPIQTFLLGRMHQLDASLETRLRAAIIAGELKKDADVAALAIVGSAVLHTLSIRARAGESRAVLMEVANSVINLICG